MIASARPNDFQTWEEFWSMYQKYLDDYGIAYVWVLRNQMGDPREVALLNPTRVMVCPPRPGWPSGYVELGLQTMPGTVQIGAEHIIKTVKGL